MERHRDRRTASASSLLAPRPSQNSSFNFRWRRVSAAGYRKLMIASMSGTQGIDNQTSLFAPSLPPRAEMERAFFNSDASYDGIFVTGVRTTGIFCRPSCRARKPLHRNIEFFAHGPRRVVRRLPAVPALPSAAPATAPRLAVAAARRGGRGSEPSAARRRPARVRRRSGARARILPRTLRHDVPRLLPRPAAGRRDPAAPRWRRARRCRARNRVRIAQRLPRRVHAHLWHAARARRGRAAARHDCIDTPLGPMIAGATDGGRLPAGVHRPAHARGAAPATLEAARPADRSRRASPPDAAARRADEVFRRRARRFHDAAASTAGRRSKSVSGAN